MTDIAPKHRFKRTATVLQSRIREVSEGRGFAQSRVLTHWLEIVGADIAAIARPVEVSYGRGGMGATLSILTTGAHAPMIEMQKEAIRTKVNAVYGYNAIARVRITQTAPIGFSEGQVEFQSKPKSKPVQQQAHETARTVTDQNLRRALEELGRNVLTKNQTKNTPH
ncbi:MAG: DUF721 domain-containing protein [Rhodobacteraceae bacterium]|nr:DUF721 domain-containing protein [Paracoccaceae bacterium]